MTEVVANYHINMNEFAAKMAGEGFQSAEVEAITKAVGENKMNAKLRGLCGDATAQDEDKKVPPDVIEMAKFAVEEYNKKAGTHLVFMEVGPYDKKILQIDTDGFVPIKICCGTGYSIFIGTWDNKYTYQDEALVFKTEAGKKTLIGYKHQVLVN